MCLVKMRLALFLTLTTVSVGAGALLYQIKSKTPAEKQLTLLPKASDNPSRPELHRAPILYDDPLPPGALVRLGSTRLRHLGASVIFSPDGKELISSGHDGTIRFWEPVTGKEKRRVRVQTADPDAFPQVYAADGKTLAGTTAKDICVWETATGREVKRFPIDKIPIPGLDKRLAMVWRFDLAPDGTMLAVQFNDFKDHNIYLWDINTGKKLFTLKPRQLRGSLTFTAGGKLMGVAGRDGLQLLDARTGQEVRKIAGASAGSPYDLAFSSDGKRVAAVSRGGVKVWNVSDGQEVLAIKPVSDSYESHPTHLAFAPDNKTLAISFGFLEQMVLYDVDAGKQLRTLPVKIGRVAFSPTGSMAASISGCVIHLWDLATGKEIGPRPGHDSMVDSLAVSPDGGKTLMQFACGTRQPDDRL